MVTCSNMYDLKSTPAAVSAERCASRARSSKPRHRNSRSDVSARVLLLAASLVALAGCASFSPDGGMGNVSTLTQERLGQQVGYQRTDAERESAGRTTQELLKAPLTPETAVQVALVNNRSLQADLAELGLAEADKVEAGRISAPQLSLSRLAGGGALEVDRSVLFNLLGLLTLPSRSHLANAQFERAQLKAAAQAVQVATEAREAFFDAVAAAQLVGYSSQVMETAQASRELASRMSKAGNLSKLDELRENAFYAQTALERSKVQQVAVSSYERLVRALELTSEQATALKLPDRLPDVPDALAAQKEAEQAAIDHRLDVLMAKRDVDATARRLGLTQVTGYVNALDVGWQNKSQTGQPTEHGVEVQVELPIFDFGAVNRRRAELEYRQAVDAAAAQAVNAQSQVREAYAAYRSAHDVARRLIDEVVPTRKRIAEENQLRYNGMLIDVFELLADARNQIDSVTASVQAQRDFWQAQTRLQASLAGSPPVERAPSNR